MREGQLRFHKFGGDTDPLVALASNQANYLRYYLTDLGAQTVLEEPGYFDRDYLAEFSAFYSVSSWGYSNQCRRCLFFDKRISRDHIRRAAEGGIRAIKNLQNSYLGFVILRPIPSAPFGRTVLKWYPDKYPKTPRVTNPSRRYSAHIAGITLTVEGLAWQQQDAGVGACATVALWSMLHSSAFDDHHAIPTTADITRFAHRKASMGFRVFPSSGLTIYQLCEAIKEAGLEPVILEGDLDVKDYRDRVFSRERFGSVSAALIRSGYPALVLGKLEDEASSSGHAVCLVGIRENAPPNPPPDKVGLQDGAIKYVYIHDDNLGPGTRFEVVEIKDASAGKDNGPGYVKLRAASPQREHHPDLPPDPGERYPCLVPSQIVAAVHENLRTSPDRLHEQAIKIARAFQHYHNNYYTKSAVLGLTLSTQFMKLHAYVGDELEHILRSQRKVLRDVRLFIMEKVPPMSLHLGVVRIGAGDTPVIDILYDTTDSDHNLRAFCHLPFNPVFGQIAGYLAKYQRDNLGVQVKAY